MPYRNTSPSTIAAFSQSSEIKKSSNPLSINPMKKNILLIEDNENILRLLQLTLKTVDAQLRVSKTGEEALVFLESNPVSMVLIDYSLPGMNGIEILHHIRALKDGSDIKVMMVTARDQTTIREQAEGLNVAAFMSKPFSPSDLVHRVQALLQLFSLPEQFKANSCLAETHDSFRPSMIRYC